MSPGMTGSGTVLLLVSWCTPPVAGVVAWASYRERKVQRTIERVRTARWMNYLAEEVELTLDVDVRAASARAATSRAAG